jgi:hypothetical protein
MKKGFPVKKQFRKTDKGEKSQKFFIFLGAALLLIFRIFPDRCNPHQPA